MGKAGEIGAFAAADVIATTPDVETLGDFFDTGPTKESIQKTWSDQR